MPIIFRSKAAAEVIMLSTHGEHMLSLMGKEKAERGVLTPEQIPLAIAAIESAISEVSHPQVSTEDAKSGDLANEATAPQAVGLAQRAWPLLQLLRAAQKNANPVTWGV